MRRKAVSTIFMAALSVAVLTAGCSSAQKDQALSTDIKARMFSDPQVKSANVDVAVKDGEATISGEVPDNGARYEAYKIASDTPGVKHVVDKMTVQSAQAAPVSQTPPSEPVPAKPPRAPKPARREAKHQVKSNAKSAGLRPDPTPAPPPVPAPAEQPEAAAPPPPAPVTPPPPPPPQPKRVEIATGTSLRVQMIDAVDSAVNHDGDMFHASLASPIVVADQIVIPAGTDLTVKLTSAKSAGHMTGQSQLVLKVVRMQFQGRTYTIESNEYTQTGDSRGKRTAETVGGGAVLGTLLGAVIGHGKGAAIGAAAGAGAGGAVQGATKGQQIQIQSEAKLDFSLQQPVEVSYFPDKNQSSRQ